MMRCVVAYTWHAEDLSIYRYRYYLPTINLGQLLDYWLVSIFTLSRKHPTAQHLP